ncbi:hypothetical protein D3C83_179520 [compost metagenome]
MRSNLPVARKWVSRALVLASPSNERNASVSRSKICAGSTQTGAGRSPPQTT